VAIVSSFVDRRFHAQSLQVALAEAKVEFAYLARAASLGALAASIAHEINQPLGAVVNSASAALRWLATQPPNLDEARQATTQTVREANRASEVIARVRALLRKEQPQMHRVDINEVVQEVLNLTAIEFAKGRITVKTELAPEIPAVLGDRVQLQQVMLNLINNAIEAMTAAENRPRELLIQSTMSDGNLQVSVHDSGAGLKPEDLDRVFRPFFTTKPKGIGMGLSISRSIIEAHGGRLWAASHDSGGAVFHFTVPKAEETG
jgi:C4-dicarboxylate-specific signal transduction histidine kinase